MNKDQVAGRVDQAKGKVKEAAGKVTGSEKLETEGVVDQAGGKVQSTYGDAKEKAKDAIKAARTSSDAHPFDRQEFLMIQLNPTFKRTPMWMAALMLAGGASR